MYTKHIGLTDIPAEEDIFEIGSYIDGLVAFVKTCKTPMTISIQGTWGTGKTSIMRMVHRKLNPEYALEDNINSDTATCKCVYFNTWEFSQFNLSNNIALVMLNQLTNAVIGDDKNLGEAFKETFGKALGVTLEIGAGWLSGGAGVKPTDAFKKEDLDQLKDLKKEFQLLINKKLGLTNKNYRLKKNTEEDNVELNKLATKERVVFFIDDLDRLNPEKAVEVLEVLKNFLDCKNCVFILAIDYDVVCRGVAGKYNFNPDDPKSSKKGKDFFDKIIQVPFKMPVEQYNITAYIEDLLGSVCIGESPLMDKNEDYRQYENLVKAAIGTNPRAIKRLVNSYQLIAMVVDFNKDIDLRQSRIRMLLFATLCLQELDINVYRAIARKKDILEPEDLLCFTDNDNIETIKQQYEELSVDEVDMQKVEIFMDLLIDILDTDKSNPLDDTELLPFRKILKIASVTGNDATTVEKKRGTSVVRSSIDELENVKNKEECRQLFKTIKDITGKEPELKDRPNDIVLVLRIPGDSKVSISFYETPNNGFTLWFQARIPYMENLPSAICDVLKHRSERKGKSVNIRKTSEGSKDMYFSFKVNNGDSDDESDVRAILECFK